jgi:hypothetical protein
VFHLTLFGGTEGEIAPSGFTALTAFGGAELRRPTLAAQLLHLKSSRQRPRRWWDRVLGSDKNLILTLFGGTVLQAPTLVEEYAAMAGLLRSGAVQHAEFQQLLDQLHVEAGDSPARTLTLFGACVTRHPSAARERKALEAAANSGSLTDRIRGALDRLIGAPQQAKIPALGQLCFES